MPGRFSHIRRLAAAAAAGASLVLPASAVAQGSPEIVGPYDGTNPFLCELQYVGTGTDFPDPEADPFCVEFDKTNQNVTDFGLAEFTAQEPARVAAASPKCFYFQRDHWTGSIVQGSEPETWHWDGSYWFDKARGLGGAHVANFRIGGAPMDPSPYAPPEYRPFFTSGGGGVMVELESDPDPTCAARVDTPEERESIYGDEALFERCIEPGGELRGKHVGRVELGMRRKQVLRRLGPPRNHRRGVDRWCLVGRGQLRVSYERQAGPAELIRSSGRGHSARGVARGDRAKRALRRLQLERLFRLGDTRVFAATRSSGRALLVGISAHHVRWLALADSDLVAGAELRRELRRSHELEMSGFGRETSMCR